jgi:hypothetical protein
MRSPLQSRLTERINMWLLRDGALVRITLHQWLARCCCLDYRAYGNVPRAAEGAREKLPV